MEFMQMYFGEKNSEPCGICDVCLQRKRHLNPKISADQFKAQVMETLKEFGELSVKDLLAKTGNPNSQENLGLIREWIEAAEISQSPEGKLKLNA